MCDRNGKRQKVWKRKPQKQNKNMKMWPISRRKKFGEKKGGVGGGNPGGPTYKYQELQKGKRKPTQEIQWKSIQFQELKGRSF